MTAGVVSPVVPSSAVGRVQARPAGLVRRPPLPRLSRLRERSTVYGLATLDDRGRIADRVVMSSLGWVSGTRLDIHETGGLVVVQSGPGGLFTVSGPGHLRIPAVVRRRCALACGDRVLLAADPVAGQLVVHPPAVLDALVEQVHAAAFGGPVR